MILELIQNISLASQALVFVYTIVWLITLIILWIEIQPSYLQIVYGLICAIFYILSLVSSICHSQFGYAGIEYIGLLFQLIGHISVVLYLGYFMVGFCYMKKLFYVVLFGCILLIHPPSPQSTFYDIHGSLLMGDLGLQLLIGYILLENLSDYKNSIAVAILGITISDSFKIGQFIAPHDFIWLIGRSIALLISCAGVFSFAFFMIIQRHSKMTERKVIEKLLSEYKFGV